MVPRRPTIRFSGPAAPAAERGRYAHRVRVDAVRAARVGVAMRIGSSVSVDGPIVVEIASRPAPSAHCRSLEDGREAVEEAHDDEVWGDHVDAVASSLQLAVE
jgi:hypothetical protein